MIKQKSADIVPRIFCGILKIFLKIIEYLFIMC